MPNPGRHRWSCPGFVDLLNGLALNAPPLPFPHSSQAHGELRELRCHYVRTPRSGRVSPQRELVAV